MEDLLRSGRIVDAILVLMAAEALAVLGWRAIRGHGPRPLPFIANLVAGMCLLLALRAALMGAETRTLLLTLTGAFIAHLTDLVTRWEHRTAELTPTSRQPKP